jgi:hypothetical protein
VTEFLARAGQTRLESSEKILADLLWWSRRGQVDPQQEEALVSRLIRDLLKGPADHYIFYHLAWTDNLGAQLADAGIPVVFVYRDPRDVVVSITEFAVTNERSRKRETLLALEPNARYHAIIGGIDNSIGLSDQFHPYEGWLSQPNTLVLKHSDLIGEAGGGSSFRQRRAFRLLARHLDLSCDVRSLLKDLHTRASPFVVRGYRGAWRAQLDGSHLDALAQTLGDSLTLWLEEPFPGVPIAPASLTGVEDAEASHEHRSAGGRGAVTPPGA